VHGYDACRHYRLYITINVVLFGGAAGCLIAEVVFVVIYLERRKKMSCNGVQETQQQTDIKKE
jgi:hypothetical protein